MGIHAKVNRRTKPLFCLSLVSSSIKCEAGSSKEFLKFYDPTEKEEEKWTHISIFGVGSGRGGRRIEATETTRTTTWQQIHVCSMIKESDFCHFYRTQGFWKNSIAIARGRRNALRCKHNIELSGEIKVLWYLLEKSCESARRRGRKGPWTFKIAQGQTFEPPWCAFIAAPCMGIEVTWPSSPAHRVCLSSAVTTPCGHGDTFE